MSARACHGSRPCGSVALKAGLDLERTAICTCARCRRRGAAPAFLSRARPRRPAGGAKRTERRFDTGVLAPLFCRTCGIEPFASGALPDGAPLAAVNVNRLEGVDAP